MSKKKAADTVKESKIAFTQKVVGRVLEKEYEEFSEMFEVFKNLTIRIRDEADVFTKDLAPVQIIVSWMTIYYAVLDYYHLILDGYVLRKHVEKSYMIQKEFKYSIDNEGKISKTKCTKPVLHPYLNGDGESSTDYWIYSCEYLKYS
jgi:hypothetical protein